MGGSKKGRGSRRILFWCVVVVANACLIYLAIRAWPGFRESVSDIHITSLREAASNLYVADLDLNGRDEIVALFPARGAAPKYISCFSPYRRSGDKPFSYYWENSLAADEWMAPPQNVDADDALEVPVLAQRPEGLSLRAFGTTGIEKLALILPYPDAPFKSDTIFADPVFRDINNDGTMDMVIAMKTGWGKSPRGLVAYELATQRILWRYYMGCYPNEWIVRDIDGDGLQEIVFSGWAPHNGAEANGTDDNHSYLLLIGSDGRLRRQIELGEYYSKVFIALGDVDGDGQLEIVASRSCRREDDPAPGRIAILGAQDLQTKASFEEPNADFSSVFLQASRDRPDIRIVTGESRGYIYLFDHQLRKLAEVRLEAPAIVMGTAKLGLDPPADDVFVFAGFSQFYLFRGDLSDKFRFRFGEPLSDMPIRFTTFARRPVYAGVLNADRLYLIERRNITPGNIVGSLWRSGLLFILVVFAGIIVFALLSIRGLSKPDEAPPKTLPSEAVLDIAHKMKNPLFTIGLEAERMREAFAAGPSVPIGEDSRTGPASILEDVQKLKAATRMLMKMSESREPCLEESDLNRFLREIGERYQALLKGSVDLVLNFEQEPILARFDPRQIEEALSNIIENAVEALPGRGTIRLSSTVVYSPGPKSRRIVEIDVEDNGRGIPEDKLEEIFKPYYTTKKDGSGIGLPIARRIIEAHGGRIEVQSRAGAGTLFAIYLPVKER